MPDYTTLCKRAKRLAVSLFRKAAGPLHLVLDSTGLKVFGEGEWKVRQHGYTKRRTWRKLHLSVDSETQEIQAVVLSEANLDDAGAVPELLDQSTEAVEQVGGDGAYDKRKVYEGCAVRGIRRVAIPPRKDARIWQHGNCADTFSLTNANCVVADASLRDVAEGGGISQSPQEDPAGAVYIPVHPDAVGTGHYPAAAQVRDDLAIPAARLAGVGFVDQQHVFAGLPGFPGQKLPEPVMRVGQHRAHRLGAQLSRTAPGPSPKSRRWAAG